MRYLVTGGQGFVGRYAVAEILRTDETAVVYATGRSRLLENEFTHDVTLSERRVAAPLPRGLRVSYERVVYIPADICDQPAIERVVAEAQPDVVLHLASGLRGDEPEGLLRTNVLGTMYLLRAVASCGSPVSMILIGSSGSVYGDLGPSACPSDESQAPSPTDAYAVTKLAQEHIANVTAREYALPIACARIFNIVGPGQDERHVCGRFASLLTGIASGKAAPRVEVGDLDAIRDFIDVRDVARGLLAIAHRGARGAVYNVASGKETSIRTILDVFMANANLTRIPVVENSIAASRETRQAANNSRLRRLGWTPAYSLQKSLADVALYYREIVNCPIA